MEILEHAGPDGKRYFIMSKKRARLSVRECGLHIKNKYILLMINSSADEFPEQGMRPVGSGLQFRVPLGCDKPGVFRNFYHFHDTSIW